MPGVSYDRAAAAFDSARSYPPGVAEQVRDAVLAHTRSGPGARILELGAGTGRIGLPFLAAGCAYVGVDLSRLMLARLHHKAAGLPGGDAVVQGDVSRLPFAAGSFAVVLGYQVLHLVADWRRALVEARRVLRPDGRLLLAGEEPIQQPDDRTASPRRLVRQRWQAILTELGAPPAPRRASNWVTADTAVAEALREQGAAVEQVELLTYAAPRTARQAVADLKARVYSTEITLPDALQAEAVRCLERWFDAACPAPDAPESARARVTALVASWEE